MRALNYGVWKTIYAADESDEKKIKLVESYCLKIRLDKTPASRQLNWI